MCSDEQARGRGLFGGHSISFLKGRQSGSGSCVETNGRGAVIGAVRLGGGRNRS